MSLSPEYRAWIKEADGLIMSMGGMRGRKTIYGHFTALLQIKRHRINSDLDNRIKAVLDYAQRIGLVVNDQNLVRDHRALVDGSAGRAAGSRSGKSWRYGSLDHAANAGRAPLSDRKDDLYETPREAVRALLAVEQILSGAIWEPAWRPRRYRARAARAAGHRVYATDLVDYGSPDQDAARIDFLMEQQAPDFHIGAIITNPPYKLAGHFVRHALPLCPRVIMLMRLAFLEQRAAIIDPRRRGELARVYIFRNRLPMMHRDGWAGPRASSPFPSPGSFGIAFTAAPRNCAGSHGKPRRPRTTSTSRGFCGGRFAHEAAA